MKTAALKLNPEGVDKNTLSGVCEKLKSFGITPYFFADSEITGDFGVDFMEPDALLKQCDFVAAIGGDGTILHAAKQAAMYSKPVLGINSGRLGFMAGLESNELDLLQNLQSGNYIKDRRMMLRIEVCSKHGTKVYHCANDAVISRGSVSRMIDVTVSFGAKTQMKYRCDGLIAATPTGSTAYSLSAGGPVLDPSINSILITPVCAHSFFARPLVLSPETVVTVNAEMRNMSVCYLTCDGEQAVTLHKTDNVVISCARNHFVDLIKIKTDTFMDVLHNKMIDGK